MYERIKMLDHVYDFHIHSFYSDGSLLPSEIARRCQVAKHKVISITDHADLSNIEHLLSLMIPICGEITETFEGLTCLPGVELTHIPPKRIPFAAKLARKHGAQIVIVHGESPVEPVFPGTNTAAIQCTEVDILAHPGPSLAEKDVREGATRDVFFEISARKGHCLANGKIAKLCLENEAKMLVNSDAHSPTDLLTLDLAWKIAEGAGIPNSMLTTVLKDYPQTLLNQHLK